MARTMKVYGTNTFISGDILEEAKKRGITRSQVRIICGAHSKAEANRLCEAEGLSRYNKKIFDAEACETGNATELALAENGGIFITASIGGGTNAYISIDELKGKKSTEPKNTIKVLIELSEVDYNAISKAYAGVDNVMANAILNGQIVNEVIEDGKWLWKLTDKDYQLGDFYCSKCRYTPKNLQLKDKRELNYTLMRYCPHCGTRMTNVE